MSATALRWTLHTALPVCILSMVLNPAGDANGAPPVDAAVTDAGAVVSSWTGATTINNAGGYDFSECDINMPVCGPGVTSCCTRPFDQAGTDKAIMIPMDRCHQKNGTATQSAPGNAAPKWCEDPTSGNDDGIFLAYGLVYRLMQAGVPVYWAINPSKDPPALSATENYASQTYTERDIDFWVLGNDSSTGTAFATPPNSSTALTACTGNCEAPIIALDDSLNPDTTYSQAQFPVRGSAFIIHAEDRTEFDTVWNNWVGTYGDVDLYEIQTNASFVWQDFGSASPYDNIKGAPISVVIDYEPPKLAVQGPTASAWLAKAGLDDPAPSGCESGGGWGANDVYCEVDIADIAAGALITGEMSWAWIPDWQVIKGCGTTTGQNAMDAIIRFMTADPGTRNGGSVMFQDATIATVEACTNQEPLGLDGTGVDGQNTAGADPYIFRYPSNTFMQFGDIPAGFAQGVVPRWEYTGSSANGYSSKIIGSAGTLRRLITEDASGGSGNTLCTNHVADAACDIFALDSDADISDLAVYARYNGVAENGIAFYMGGNQVTQNGNAAHLRMLMNAVISVPMATVHTTSGTGDVEVSRAAPIVAPLGSDEYLVQGTYVIPNEAFDNNAENYSGTSNDTTFRFPKEEGHMRAVLTSALNQTGVEFTSFGDPSSDTNVLLDAAYGIPDPESSFGNCSGWGAAVATGNTIQADGTCRTVFTNTATGTNPTVVPFSVTYNTQLKALLDPSSALSTSETDTLISRLLAGRKDDPDDPSSDWVPSLGGVDRSTVAIIEASSVAGDSSRPTMIYFGGTDGMIHAVCGQAVGVCPAVGAEMWSFVPRTQMGLLRKNSQRIDGSPKVADIFGNFNGTNEWRTVMIIQTGWGDPTTTGQQPSVIALDISNPGEPGVLWEVTTPASRTGVDQGIGMGIAMGATKINNTIAHTTFVQTNNGGTGTSATLLMALDTVTGEVRKRSDGTDWRVELTYLSARDNANNDVPNTGIPGGIATLDLNDVGRITHLVVPSLYGDLWYLKADDGSSMVSSGGTDLPIVRFGEDFHPIGAPPTLYRDRTTGDLAAVAVTGGYADQVGDTTWSPATSNQYAIAVALKTGTQSYDPLDTADASNFLLNIDLGVGARAFAQAVVAGNELLITTDSDDVNSAGYGTNGDTGTLTRVNLSDGSSTSYSIRSGAGSVDATASGAVYTGGSSTSSRTLALFDSNGATVLIESQQTGKRSLWLRTR